MIIHTVRKGHYMRTLRPPHNLDYVMNIPMLAVDDMGHVIVYCHETFPIDPKVGPLTFSILLTKSADERLRKVFSSPVQKYR